MLPHAPDLVDLKVGFWIINCSPDTILRMATDKRLKQVERECHLEKTKEQPCDTRNDLENAWKEFMNVTNQYRKVEMCHAFDFIKHRLEMIECISGLYNDSRWPTDVPSQFWYQFTDPGIMEILVGHMREDRFHMSCRAPPTTAPHASLSAPLLEQDNLPHFCKGCWLEYKWTRHFAR
uniref:PDEase domain-containing protein n=1 Tax=Angiostrongylus cantonensis TaxID=6313 RepID=A0A0K0DE32_ANGCA